MLVLGSKSKARYQLLRLYNAEITQISCEIDESFDENESIEQNIMNVAYKKAQKLFNQVSKEDILICADTICINNKKILTKPKNFEEAFSIIKSYSNQIVEVISGVYIQTPIEHQNFYEKSYIKFSTISDENIIKYLYENPDYMNVAGALSIETISKYVNISIQGSYSNIVGLPMERISKMLYDHNLLNNIDYSTKEIDNINIYRSSVRVLPIKNEKIYLLKGYTTDLKETFYTTIGGGYHIFEDKIESLKKEAQEEGGLTLSNINPIINVAEYNSLNRFIPYNKLTLHSYYEAKIENIGKPSYVEYENELLIGIESFSIKEAKNIFIEQYMYFKNKPYPVSIISQCDLQAVLSLEEKDQKTIIYDMHADLISHFTMVDEIRNEENIFENYHLNNFQKGNVKLSVFNLWIDQKPAQSKKRVLEMLNAGAKALKQAQEHVNIVYSYTDITNDKINAVIGLEGLDYLDKASEFYTFYQYGARLVSLTWNYENAFASSSACKVDSGLSKEGVKLVRLLNKLNVIVDISHASDKSALKILELSNKPVVASHSNVRNIVDHKRNLTDELIIKIAESNGVIGMNAFGVFVSENEDNPTIDELIKHINYIKNLVGIDYIALGFDHMDYLDEIEDVDVNATKYYIDDLQNQKDSQNLINALYKEGYTKEEIDKIAYQNFDRVLKEVLND
ncbi:membrane dipeptidase [Mycoplasma sp. P36-A1]|uniref:membrane dipeptidase n=1 Tax=Mycoplasma sp. P36-A1 TaxID=3252900 RepID=UPI003C2C7791